MKFNQLRDIIAIADKGSLRAAARHLGLAQPALTRSVRALEHELGTTLFERETRGMVLTPKGQLFYQRAKAVVNEMRRAREEIEQSSGEMHGNVVMGLSIMPHVGMLPHALPIFRQQFPHIKLKIIEGLYPAMEAGLRDGSIDFYLGASPRIPPEPGLSEEVLFKNTRKVVARKDHPLAGATSIKELRHADWATTSVDYNATEDLETLFAKYKMGEPSVMLQADSALSVIVALAYGNLLAILPVQWHDFPLAREMLQIIPIKEVLPAPSITLIRRPDLPLTPAAEYFCDLLRRFTK